jgi:hypothetical protein
LQALLPLLVESLERHGHLSLDPEVREGLLNKSRPTAAQWIPAVFDGKMCANGPI